MGRNMSGNMQRGRNRPMDFGGNSSFGGNSEFGRGFGSGFGRNPDWLSQQPSGYSNNYGDSYGFDNSQPGDYYAQDYNQGSYDNYNNDYFGNNSQGGYQNVPRRDHRDRRDRGRGPPPDRKRPRRDEPRKSGKPEKKARKPAELPKPTQSVKILAQLKGCPFGVNVYQSQNKKLPITEKEFTEIMSNVNQKWMDVMDTSEEKLKIDGSEWYKNRGIILCKDEFTKKWITESIEGVQIGGRQFKAWGVGEAGDVVDVTVLLGSVLDSCPDPKDVIMKALKNSEVEYEKVEVVNVNKTEKGRMVNLLMDGKCVNTLKFKKNGKIFAGLAELKFEF